MALHENSLMKVISTKKFWKKKTFNWIVTNYERTLHQQDSSTWRYENVDLEKLKEDKFEDFS